MFESDVIVRTRLRIRWLLALSLMVGMAAAAYMTYESLRYLQDGESGHRLCSFSRWINCDASVTSPYAFILGVPIAWVALMFFISIACLVNLPRWLPKCASAALTTAAMLCIAAASVSLCMLMILLLKIKAICIPCVLIQTASFALCAILVGAMRGLPKPTPWPSAVVLFTLVQGFYGGGVVGLLNFQMNYLAPKPVDVAREVKQYLSEPSLIDVSALDPAPGGALVDKVQILCFLDFQCPECRRVASLLPGWLGNLKEKCQITHLQFPLDASVNPYKPNGRHTQAGLAAKAAICFHQLGVSETLERRMFHFQRSLSLDTILSLAAAANVNTNSLLRMIESSETRNILARDIELAHTAGVSATPTLFIDGRRVALYYEPEVLRGIVAAETTRQKSQGGLGVLDN
jgi:protein-disulfide isomerase/uncharacterized membrane protein